MRADRWSTTRTSCISFRPLSIFPIVARRLTPPFMRLATAAARIDPGIGGRASAVAGALVRTPRPVVIQNAVDRVSEVSCPGRSADHCWMRRRVVT
jgi:hypothetical protein